MNAPAQIRPEAAESPSEAPDERMPPRVRRWARAADYLLEGAAIGLMIVVAVGISVYVGRRGLVADLAENYLERRGVEAEIEVEHVDSRGFIGRVRLGPADDPDFVAERVEVALAAPPPPEGPYALRPTAIRIIRPQLKGRWTGERLSFGSLDSLIDEALKRPKTDDPSPLVVIQDGSLRLGTPYGLVRAAGSGVVDDARLVRLDLSVRPTRLSGRGFTTALGAARLRARVQGRTVRLSARAPFEELKGSDARVRGGLLTLEGELPYPDMDRSRVDGALRLDGVLHADAASAAGLTTAASETRFRLSGDLSGPLADPSFRGAVDGTLRTQDVRGEGWRARGVRVALDSLAPQDLVLQGGRGGLEAAGAVRVALGADAFTGAGAAVQGLDAAVSSRSLRLAQGRGGWRLSGPARVTATAARASSGDLAATGLSVEGSTTAAILQGQRVPVSGSARAQGVRHAGVRGGAARDVRLDFSGDAGAGGARLQAALQGGAAFERAAAARLAREVPVLGGEPAYAGAIARALADARVSAPGLRLTVGGGRADAALTQAVRLSSASGARIEISPTGSAPVFDGRGGAFRLAVRGGGLPEVDADVSRYQLASGGVTADLRARTTLDLAIAQGASIEARGRAVSRGGVFEFAAAECVRVAAATIELGENDLKDLSTRLCPVREGALIRASDGGYRVRARAEGAAVAVPFLETRISNGRGVLDARGGDAGLTAVAARIEQAEADDTAAVRRYHPVALNGTAALAGGDWTAELALLERLGGAPLGSARVRHDQASGEGTAAIAAENLAFGPEGLQPHDLTPLGVGAVSKVQGAVDFQGEIAWNEVGATSRGRVATAGLDFDSPAGRVIGLKGDVVLSSLTPLVAPSGQSVTADRVEGFLPIEDPVVRFALSPEALSLESAVFALADGKVTVEPLSVPLAGGGTLSGAVQLDDVDVGQLVEATQFADKVEFQAVVDGRVPFQTGPDGLRFQAGTLRSTRPGRLSIDREVLSGVEATGGPAAEGEAPPSAFQDLAYDAMENLAYDQMEVSVDSRPGGRLGMIFTIRGRHDPPVAEEARISIFDLIRGKALERDIPLPKGTPVNLTLDTSINFDELLAAYMDLNRARSGASAPVQP